VTPGPVRAQGDELKELLAAATPGPWEFIDGPPVQVKFPADATVKCTRSAPVTIYAREVHPVNPLFPDTRQHDAILIPYTTNDAALIVAAVNALPAYLALVAEKARLVEALAELWAAWPKYAKVSIHLGGKVRAALTSDPREAGA
jgi:hypothetical protein